MTGEDIFRQALPELGALPVLFITAYGDIEQAVRLMRGGADDYLTKPFDIDDFLERIERLLGSQRARRAPPQSRGCRSRCAGSRHCFDAWPTSTAACCSPGRAASARRSPLAFSTRSRRVPSAPFMAVNCAAIPGGAHGKRAVRPREAARLPALTAGTRAMPNGRGTACSSWTRSATCRAAPGQTAAPARGPHVPSPRRRDADHLPGAGDLRDQSRPGSADRCGYVSVRTCSIGSTSSRSPFRRCGIAPG